MKQQWVATLVLLGLVRSAFAQPLQVVRAHWGGERTLASQALAVAGPVPALGGIPAARELPKVRGQDEVLLVRVMERELTEFVRCNYPSRLASAVRGLQRQEGDLWLVLQGSAGFLREYAAGPVSIEGGFREVRGKSRYVVAGTLHGVAGRPRATIRFETYPGFMGPFTQVAVDWDGDGRVDERSANFSRMDRIRGWVEAKVNSK